MSAEKPPVRDGLIAVTGMSCRLPKAPDPDAFWRLLHSGGDAITKVPAGRQEVDQSRLSETLPGVSYGGYLESIDRFDAEFFGISPREAIAIDPQQRLVLELSWEALEDAGVAPGNISGDQIGVFIGANRDDYAMLLRQRGWETITAHSNTGLQRGMIANRVSYTLGLTGPSLTVDTAQSSSLVAVHLACESLLRGECSSALVGGVKLNISPETALEEARFGGLSPDGRCYTFDSRANGYARGEGGAVVVLKPLPSALADGDPVYCVIRGSAMNNDGASDGLTVPSRVAQEAVITLAHQVADSQPADVQYVELHGTGTPVGDPVEAAALGASLGRRRREQDPLLVGSAKTNIGHLESAAGIVGFLKVALAIHHREIPASLNFREPNPLIPLDELNLRVQTEATPWPRAGQPLLAGVSSFGMGGTNCHVVVGEAAGPGQDQQDPPVPSSAGSSGPAAWVLSARSAPALAEQAARLRASVRDRAPVPVRDVAYSLATTRPVGFSRRLVVLGQDRDQLLDGLAAAAAGSEAAGVVSGQAGGGRVAVVFSGQGSQRPGMGLGLHAAYPVYARAFDEVRSRLDVLLPRPLREVIAEGGPDLDQTLYAQAGLFAVQVALFRLMSSWGVRPACVAGHSVGELAAAYVAGVWDLDGACAVVAARGRLMQQLPAGGAMAALDASADQAAGLVAGRGDAAVAAVNGPSQVVISGAGPAVEELARAWRDGGGRARRLRVSHAFHSPLMDPMLEEFARVLAGVRCNQPRIPLVSGTPGADVTDPAYWVAHVRDTVRYGDAVQAMHAQGAGIFVELGPDAALSGMADPDAGIWIPALRSGQDEPASALRALAGAYVAGADVDWAAVAGGAGAARKVALPTYPFQRQRYWPPAVSRRGDTDGPAEGRFWQAIDKNDIEALTGLLRLPAAERSVVESLMPALAGLRRLQRSHAKLNAQLYRVEWEPVTTATRPADRGDWLVLVPPGFPHEGAAAEVIEALSADGGEVHRLQIDPSQLNDAIGERYPDVAGIVSFVPLPAPVGTGVPVWTASIGAASVESADPAGSPWHPVIWDRPSMSGGRGGCLDLPRTWDAATPSQVRAVLSGQYAEDRLALRPTGVHASRVRPALIDVSTSRLPWKPTGTVLLAGDDNGPLATALIRWLAAAGAEVIRGTDVPPAAGAVVYLPDERAGAQDIEALRRLREQTVDLDLSAFVVVTPARAQLGLESDEAERAYSAFADALVRLRRVEGRAATTIGWQGAGASVVDGLTNTGPDDLVEALAWAAGQDDAGVIVADLTDELRATILNGPRHEITAAPGTGIRAIDTAADTDERQLVRLVLTHAAEVLGHEKPADVDVDRSFRDQGFESYTAIELRNRLTTATGINLPTSVLFDYPTPAALVAYLRQCLTNERAVFQEAPTAITPADEPVAIVGMGCRFPGGVEDPEGFWRLLAGESDAMTGFPADRGWDDGSGDAQSYARVGGFLSGAGLFDAEFFGISPREALGMDPQQRLLLETCWEALEDAGIEPGSLQGSSTGVYAGISALGWAGDQDGAAGYGLTGTTASVASGRVAYCLGLQGPAVSVDTACSSSLTAMHLAAQALRAGECSMALAGGVAVMATPGMYEEFALQRGLAADGRCKPFADAADGTGWGEGVGVLVLERLSDARRHGHRVLAVVRGSAVNQDGASNGLSAPNGPSQQRVIRQALASAGLSAADVDAVEAHGTGTALGDPIEAQALLATYGQDRDGDRPLLLGSVKSNIGHTQAAAGVAGVIKMVLAMRHGVLPRTLHADVPSRHVDWEAGSVELLSQARPWPEGPGPRRAAVSAFGISGTNVHLILEQDQQPEEPGREEQPDLPDPLSGPAAWVLSARSAPALAEQAARLRASVLHRAPVPVRDVAYSLATTRPLGFSRRLVVLGQDRDQLLDGLAAAAAGGDAAGVVSGTAGPAVRPVFVFAGQGAQWAGMGLRLWEEEPAFAGWMQRCALALEPFADWRLRDALGDEGLLGRVDVVQPASWAVMVSLAGLWRACGVEPSAVLGHSQGEIAAACAAGGLSLQDGARVVALRSRALAALAGTGGMVSVPAPLAEVREWISPWGDGLSVAAVNGPRQVVVAGTAQACGQFTAAHAQHGARRIAVGYASHTAHVEAVRDQLARDLAGLSPTRSTVPFYSTVEAGELDTAVLDGGYWYRNLRETVRFGETVAGLTGQGHRTFVEISTHPVLGMAVAQAGEDLTVTASLHRGDGGRDRWLRALAEAWVAGAGVDWPAVTGDEGRARKVPLPTYPFQRQRYWPRAVPRRGDVASAGQQPGGHPLLAAAVWLAEGDALVLTGRLSLAAVPWLADHSVHGTVLLAGTAFVDLAVHAGDLVSCATLDELVLQEPLVLPERGGVQIQVHVGAGDADGRRPVAVSSREQNGGWLRHATGVLSPEPEPEPAPAPLPAWPPAGAQPVEIGDPYPRLAERGYQYGPVFQGLRRVWRDDDSIYVEAQLPETATADADGYGLHPALLDAVLHGPLADTSSGSSNGGGAKGLPFAWTGVRLLAGGARHLRAVLTHGPGGTAVTAFDPAGQPVLQARSLIMREIPAEHLDSRGDREVRQSLFTVDWTALPAGPDPEPVRWRRHGQPAGPDRAPVTVAVLPASAGQQAAAGAHQATTTVLGWLQPWLADPGTAGERLVIWTQGAADGTDLAAAAVTGLIRSAQSEHPGRLVLVDVDPAAGLDAGRDGDVDAVLAAALGADEPEIWIRPSTESGNEGLVVFGRRLTRPGEQDLVLPGGPLSWDRDGTVLITGGTGVLGAELARHLVSAQGMRHLVLMSRQGPRSEGVAVLAAELAASGAKVRIVAGDAAQRDVLATVLAVVPDDHPLTAVVHAAGVLDDATVESLTPERIAAVLAVKADAAWNLHELTRGLDLAGFVLYSSAAAALGSAGQGSYAAANAFLDALAARRRERGLAGQSLAWGLWAKRSAMTGHLDETDLSRMARGGMQALTVEQGLALFDAAAGVSASLVVLARLDLAGLSRAGDRLPPLLRELTAGTAARPAAAMETIEGLAGRLAGLSTADREQAVLSLVQEHAAAVLGHARAADVEPQQAFLDMGFDSLTALELRNRLAAATGLQLPATLIFDHPAPAELAEHLYGLLAPQLAPAPAAAPTESAPSVASWLDDIEQTLFGQDANVDELDAARKRLEDILQKIDRSRSTP